MDDVLYMITIFCACVAFILMLFAFKPADEQPSGIRRHNGSNRVWPYASLDDDDTVIIGQIQPVHTAQHAQQRDHNFLVVEEPPHLSTGRHSIENVHRVLVPTGWMPPLGSARIALIDTPTSEYLIARRPRPRPYHNIRYTGVNYAVQVRDDLVGPPPNFARKYVTHPGMVNV